MDSKSVLEKVGKVFKWLGIGLVILLIEAMVLMAIDYILPEGWKLDAQIFVVLASVVLSVTWTFLPTLRVSFAALEDSVKAIVNLILMILFAGLMFLFTCTNWSPIPGVVCTVQGAKALAVLVFLAIAGNQITYVLSVPPADVKAAKASRASG